MTWSVYFTRKACKQLAHLPHTVQELVDLAVLDLEEQGVYPRGWNSLKTETQEYRLRLNYRYRMRYRLAGPQAIEIEIFYVGHRKEAYR